MSRARAGARHLCTSVKGGEAKLNKVSQQGGSVAQRRGTARPGRSAAGDCLDLFEPGFTLFRLGAQYRTEGQGFQGFYAAKL